MEANGGRKYQALSYGQVLDLYGYVKLKSCIYQKEGWENSFSAYCSEC